MNVDSGGVLAVTRFLKAAAATTSTLKLNGGTLRARNSQVSPNLFLPDLAGLQTIVSTGGVIVDTNGFDATIAEVLEYDSTLDPAPDGGLTKNGRGTLTLTGANTFTGGLTVNAGTALATFSRVTLDNDSAAGIGTIILADSFAELRLFGTTGRSIANPIVISNTGDEKSLIYTQAGTATCSGPITINETNIDHFRVRSDSSNFTLSGKISGPGGIFRYAGGSVVVLNNAENDFTGGAKITAGTLGFTSGALGTTGSILMDGGTLRWETGNDQDISSRLTLVDAKTATINVLDANSFVTFANAIGNDSAASLVKSGAGWLTLSAASTYSGGSTATAGILNFASDGLGTTGSITLNGGTLRWAPGNTEDISSRIVMLDGRAARITSVETVTLANAIGNASTASLEKSGSGIIALEGANTYTGATSVTGGTLLVNGALDAASAVTVTGGKLGGSVTVAAAGNLAPGVLAGTLSIGGGLDVAAMAGGAGKLKFELDSLAGINDGIAVTGTLTLGVGALGLDDFEFTNLGGLQAGTYTLVTSGGINSGDSLDANNLSGTIATGFDGALQVDGSTVKLMVTAAAPGGYDSWKTQITNGQDQRDQDADADGFTNLQEFLFGTSPIASNGALVTTTTSGGNLVLRWLQRENGATYAIKQSATLAANSWSLASPQGSMDANQTGAPADYDYHTATFPTTGAKLFFRIEGLEN